MLTRTRVIVVDDSETLREQLVAILSSDPLVEVAGTANNGLDGIELTARARPDVVVMDINMPVMDGFTATRAIMTAIPTPVLICSTELNMQTARVSMRALGPAAVGAIAKPIGPSDPDFDAACERLVGMVKALGRIRVSPPRDGSEHALHPERSLSAAPIRVVVLSTSAGGRAALDAFLSGLPLSFAAPILAVADMAPGRVEAAIEWIDAASLLRTKLAEDGELLASQTVYFAPDDVHLQVIDQTTLSLSNAAPVGGKRPSARVLFESVARAFGPAAAAVVLSNVDYQEMEGLRAIHTAGGRIIARAANSAAPTLVCRNSGSSLLPDSVLPFDTLPPEVLATVPVDLARVLFHTS